MIVGAWIGLEWYCTTGNCPGVLSEPAAGFLWSNKNISYGKYWEIGGFASVAEPRPSDYTGCDNIRETQGVGWSLLHHLTQLLYLMMRKSRHPVAKWLVQCHRGSQEQSWDHNSDYLTFSSVFPCWARPRWSLPRLSENKRPRGLLTLSFPEHLWVTCVLLLAGPMNCARK